MAENIATTQAASRREVAIFALALGALLAVIVALTDGLMLFSRPLWVDEWLTVLPASRTSPIDVLADLRAGVDGGAGLLHLTMWALRGIAGSLSPSVLRAFAFACVFTALCVTFVVLRRRFSVDASSAGALAVGANVLVVTHAFEARFYGPWLLCCVLFAWTMSRHQRRSTRGTAIGVAAASVALCTVHFYGVITLVVMCAGIVSSHGRRMSEALRLVAVPLVSGTVAVLAILPLALGQRAAYSRRTWVPEFSIRQLTGLLEDFWLTGIPLFGAAALIIAGLLVMTRPGPNRSGVMQVARSAASDAGIVAMASLALMPIALAIVSVAGQPSMLSRYAITTVLAWSPFIAWAMDAIGRAPARVFRIVLAWFWFVSFTKVVAEKQTFSAAVAQQRMTFASALQSGNVVVFPSIHVMYPVTSIDRTTAGRAVFLDLPDSILGRLFPANSELERNNRGAVIQRDLARVHARRFGFPSVAGSEALDTTARFLFFAPAFDLPSGFASAEAYARALFPQRITTAVHRDVIVSDRRQAPR